MARNIHIANDEKRDATLTTSYVVEAPPPSMGLPGKTLTFHKILAATEAGLHEGLVAAHGEDYGQALIDGDPEVDMELVGHEIGSTDTVYISRSGEVLYASPQLIDVIYGPDGSERERREAKDTPANVEIEDPIRWGSRRMPVAEVVRRFAFRRALRVEHVDGLTYDFCHQMATQLHEAGEMVLVGAGPKGNEPLVFQDNGKPYRAFLGGEVDGTRYRLRLYLTDLELKLPREEGK